MSTCPLLECVMFPYSSISFWHNNWSKIDNGKLIFFKKSVVAKLQKNCRLIIAFYFVLILFLMSTIKMSRQEKKHVISSF